MCDNLLLMCDNLLLMCLKLSDAVAFQDILRLFEALCGLVGSLVAFHGLVLHFIVYVVLLCIDLRRWIYLVLILYKRMKGFVANTEILRNYNI